MEHKIKTFEDACSALNISTDLPDFSSFPKEDQAAMIAHAKLVLIAKALNEGWIPDFTNWDERKYFPYFEYKSGFGFSYYGWTRSYTDAYVGARLCFKSSELAEYAGKQFTEIYKSFLTVNK